MSNEYISNEIKKLSRADIKDLINAHKKILEKEVLSILNTKIFILILEIEDLRKEFTDTPADSLDIIIFINKILHIQDRVDRLQKKIDELKKK